MERGPRSARQLTIASPAKVAQLQMLIYLSDGAKWVDSGALIWACSVEASRHAATFPASCGWMGTVPIVMLRLTFEAFQSSLPASYRGSRKQVATLMELGEASLCPRL